MGKIKHVVAVIINKYTDCKNPEYIRHKNPNDSEACNNYFFQSIIDWEKPYKRCKG
jgi:hypothetical protein